MAFARLFLAAVLTLTLTVRPAAAQSILRDTETEAFFADMARPIVKASGLEPSSVKIVLVGDPSINAFVMQGQAVYIHSGLIRAADNVEQVQGVVAHEIGHITGGHVIRFSEGISQATGITIMSLLLGAAAVAAGAPDAGMAIIAGGQQAAMSKFLAFSRSQESAADIAGAGFLSKAGISGRGSLAFFKKLQNQEYRLAIPQKDSYGRTHPLSGERIAVLEGLYHKDPAWDKPVDKELDARFQRIKAKLTGYVEDAPQVMRLYPETDQSIAGHYARAYAWHRAAYPDKAGQEVKALLATNPHDPYFLELQGQILLESGRPEEAIAPLREAVDRSGSQPMIASMLGHALIATENPAYIKEARQILRVAVGRDPQNPFAWYQLGLIYAREGDEPRAALATAERYNLEGNHRAALANAQIAMRDLPAGSADWIRAQDIAMVSRNEVKDNKRKRR